METIRGTVTYVKHNARKTVTKLRLGVKTWAYIPCTDMEDLLGASVEIVGQWKGQNFYGHEIKVSNTLSTQVFKKIEHYAKKKNKKINIAFYSDIGKKILTGLYMIGKKTLVESLITSSPKEAVLIIRNPFELYLRKKTDYHTAEVLSFYQPFLLLSDKIYPTCVHILEEEYKNKNESLPLEHLKEKVSIKLQTGIEIQQILESINRKTSPKVVIKEGRAYLAWVYWCKLHALRILKNNTPSFPIETNNPIIADLLSYRWAALTGKPGTGKTTLIRQIKHHCPDAILAATTGKAAKQLSSDAQTVHSILGFGKSGFKIKKLDCPLLVVDEASMLDWVTLYAIVRAVPKAIFVGDPGQLPPVRGESVFRQIISTIPTYELEKVYRFKEGESPSIEVIKRPGYNNMIETVKTIAAKLQKEGRNYQIITPLVQTAQDLNRRIKGNNLEFHIGDKVIVTRNIYADGILVASNGQVGVIAGRSGRYYRVRFGNNSEVNLLSNEVSFAYALTVHKSQGSEYDYVIFAIPPGVREDFLTEELMLVGKTRGRVKTYVVETV